MLASDLFALAHQAQNSGPDRCHWCGAACARVWPHDEPPGPTVFHVRRPRTSARFPGNSYICTGCWYYRRQRVTIRFLTGGWQDIQTPARHAWWITSHGAWGVRSADHAKLYELLRKPPLRFVLALRSDACARNELHLQELNDHEALRADTKLRFTIDHLVHEYTIHELESLLKTGAGASPGVNALQRYLGPPPAALTPGPQEKKERGRPPDAPDGKSTQAYLAGKINASGALAAEALVQDVQVLPSAIGGSSR